MTEIQFYIDDRKSCTLMADNLPVIDNIPYRSDKLVDHRGYYLWRFLGEQGIQWDEITFENLSDNDISEITRGFDYCDSGFPEIVRSIKQRELLKLKR